MNFRAQISSTAFYEFWYIEWYSTMMSCYHWWFIILPRFMNFRLIFLPRIINFRLKWVYRVSAFTAFYECTRISNELAMPQRIMKLRRESLIDILKRKIWSLFGKNQNMIAQFVWSYVLPYSKTISTEILSFLKYYHLFSVSIFNTFLSSYDTVALLFNDFTKEMFHHIHSWTLK